MRVYVSFTQLEIEESNNARVKGVSTCWLLNRYCSFFLSLFLFLVKPCNRSHHHHHRAVTEVSSSPFMRNKLLLCWIAICLFSSLPLASLLDTHPSLHNEIDHPSKSYFSFSVSLSRFGIQSLYTTSVVLLTKLSTMTRRRRRRIFFQAWNSTREKDCLTWSMKMWWFGMRSNMITSSFHVAHIFFTINITRC